MVRPSLMAAAVLLIGAADADAKIVCHDQYQVTGGQEISTPYCNDAYFARVAREHGFKVTDDQIRNDPSLKDQVCRWAGSDIRIEQYCPDNGGSEGPR